MAQRGLVVSDLHMLSDRSRGDLLWAEIKQSARTLDLLVLNGDTFDFAWTSRPTIAAAVTEAITLVSELAGINPLCQIYYILGNHDCRPEFVAGLTALSEEKKNLMIVEDILRLGSNLFLHGEACNGPTSPETLKRQRQQDGIMQPRSAFAKGVYQYIIILGLNRVVYLTHRSSIMMRRIHYYLSHLDHGIVTGVNRIFFGHTHAPLRRKDHSGVEFINTGSGIKGLAAEFCEFFVQ